jgi:hypothetical protein
MMPRARCGWCARFVRKDQPAFTWYRDFGPMMFDNAANAYVPDGPVYGWTDPRVLCPECAGFAHAWFSCHKGLFAEVAS